MTSDAWVYFALAAVFVQHGRMWAWPVLQGKLAFALTSFLVPEEVFVHASLWLAWVAPLLVVLLILADVRVLCCNIWITAALQDVADLLSRRAELASNAFESKSFAAWSFAAIDTV